MKKTFFTLLALSGVAMASEPMQQDYSSSITLDHGWMLEFEITTNTLSAETTHVFFKAQGNGGGPGAYVSNSIIGLTDNNTINGMNASGTLNLTLGTMYRMSFDKGTSILYLADTTTGNYVTADWAAYTAYANMWQSSFYESNDVTVTAGKVYDMNGITGESFKNYATAVSVPEPTTATLSLLALAGLAARRRRK
ncbi:MAG: PEP-CTERM sorting domain-containing protein [Akkermansia sp.]|nr:PEP-CTERM sorting domain-containing protein [Akkermansia sp.]